MTESELRDCCWAQYNLLLQSYFGDFAVEAAKGKTEVLDDIYTDTLPLTIADKYRSFLLSLWSKIAPIGAPPYEELVTTKRASEVTTEEYEDFLERARTEAKTVTFFEKITRSNHKDVSYYKGLLKQYTEELMRIIMEDFLGDAVKYCQ